MAWTDERLDDLAGRMDAGFARVDHEIRDLRTEVGGLRRDMQRDIAELRTTMLRFGVALMVAMAGMIATLIGAIATGAGVG